MRLKFEIHLDNRNTDGSHLHGKQIGIDELLLKLQYESEKVY